MEYIKTEELIIGEIYKADNGSLTYIMKATKDLENVKNIPKYCDFMKHGCFNRSYLTFTNATSEEKHWLNTCIKLDKFITFEEAMKTFIPEYVECANPQGWITTIKENNGNLIFKNDFKSTCHTQIKDLNLLTGSQFKPSTKEAYDAQFVVKEPEFVLPKKWCVLRNEKNHKTLNKWCNENKLIGDMCSYTDNVERLIYSEITNSSWNKYKRFSNKINDNYIEITFEQFKKYVLKEETAIEFGNKIDKEIIEPLPQFKVIETIETITKVENNEGNQFFIGDIVKSNYSEVIHYIKGFKYNVDKTNILAITEKLPGGIGIDKIEHYIEPKVEVKEETLLEKAKRLYPIGTKFKAARGSNGEYKVQSNSEFRENGDGAICIQTQGNGTIYYNGVWGEIIE